MKTNSEAKKCKREQTLEEFPIIRLTYVTEARMVKSSWKWLLEFYNKEQCSSAHLAADNEAHISSWVDSRSNSKEKLFRI